jgi:PAS domain S-box-containing protein
MMATTREKYQTLVELAPDPIFLTDMSTAEILEVNEQAAELLGYERSTIEGKPVTEMHPTEQSEQYRTLFERTVTETAIKTSVLDDGTQIALETRSGVEIPVELHAKTIDMDGEEGPWVYSIVRDLREQLERERKLRQFEEAVNQTAHAVYITDTDGKIEYVNSAFQEMFGYDEQTILTETPRILQSGEHDDELYTELWETILSGESWQHEVVDERKDGERIVLNQTISPLTGDEGSVEKFVAVAQDITERKQYEQRLKEQRDNLQLLNQVVRHDIRNDLQVIQTYGEVLEESVDEAGLEHLRTLQESADSAIELTNTARELAEVMLQTEADTDSVALGDILAEEIQACRESYPEATVEVDGPLPDVDVVGNESLGSVFGNLLTNAVVHNDKVTPQVTVSVDAASTDDVDIRIADNGPGVPDGQKETIFGKGEKGLESEGTGIGLYLVRSLVTSYGGDVRVEDNDPDGAVFVVELPESPA